VTIANVSRGTVETSGRAVVVFWQEHMIWFFDRDGDRLRYEISHDRSSGCYRLVVTRPDGSESVEELDQPTELIERSVELMNSLRTEGWRVS
jgi:hypothetical protein